MSKIPYALALLLAASPVLAADTKAGGFGEGGPDSYIWAEIRMNQMHMAMAAMDKNKDRMISKEEFMAYATTNAGKNYMMMDIDNDGMVSEMEWMNSELYPASSFYGNFR